MTMKNDEKVAVEQVDYDLAEEVVSAANIVSVGGYYEIDIDKVAEVLACHRLRTPEPTGVERAQAGKQRCPACHVEFEKIDDVDAHLASLSASPSAESGAGDGGESLRTAAEAARDSLCRAYCAWSKYDDVPLEHFEDCKRLTAALSTVSDQGATNTNVGKSDE